MDWPLAEAGSVLAWASRGWQCLTEAARGWQSPAVAAKGWEWLAETCKGWQRIRNSVNEALKRLRFEWNSRVQILGGKHKLKKTNYKKEKTKHNEHK